MSRPTHAVVRELAETFVKAASIVGKFAETSVKSENDVRKLSETSVKLIKLTCKSAQTFAESAGQSHTFMQHPDNDA